MTARPQRIQLRRTKGWRNPEGAVVVARPGRWGNPLRIERGDCSAGDGVCWQVSIAGVPLREHIESQREARAVAVALCRERIERNADLVEKIRTELAGRDLACWCPLDQPCHADVLLEIANGADQ